MRNLLTRLRVLADGQVSWEGDDGSVEHERLSFADRWAMFGVHSYNWWWVRRWGRQSCGCTINSLTRRTVLFCKGCALGGWDD